MLPFGLCIIAAYHSKFVVFAFKAMVVPKIKRFCDIFVLCLSVA